ncbi:hypothetical protein QBC42DRAFT_322485 [Cladorrhinum samala]|uniref:Uncharacterized protein n=1 Tax=Cladorrhinum samala TaxID=585594 RepID=A0AAV9HTC7_9PEZI|nr:hypothetical protein QBC42DRAFT_322485 [Cladorrhinum samala]
MGSVQVTQLTSASHLPPTCLPSDAPSVNHSPKGKHQRLRAWARRSKGGVPPAVDPPIRQGQKRRAMQNYPGTDGWAPLGHDSQIRSRFLSTWACAIRDFPWRSRFSHVPLPSLARLRLRLRSGLESHGLYCTYLDVHCMPGGGNPIVSCLLVVALGSGRVVNARFLFHLVICYPYALERQPSFALHCRFWNQDTKHSVKGRSKEKWAERTGPAGVQKTRTSQIAHNLPYTVATLAEYIPCQCKKAGSAGRSRQSIVFGLRKFLLVSRNAHDGRGLKQGDPSFREHREIENPSAPLDCSPPPTDELVRPEGSCIHKVRTDPLRQAGTDKIEAAGK